MFSRPFSVLNVKTLVVGVIVKLRDGSCPALASSTSAHHLRCCSRSGQFSGWFVLKIDSIKVTMCSPAPIGGRGHVSCDPHTSSNLQFNVSTQVCILSQNSLHNLHMYLINGRDWPESKECNIHPYPSRQQGSNGVKTFFRFIFLRKDRIGNWGVWCVWRIVVTWLSWHVTRDTAPRDTRQATCQQQSCSLLSITIN